jgi:hypothetical protein
MLHSIYATLGISYLLYTLRTLLALPLALAERNIPLAVRSNIMYDYSITRKAIDAHRKPLAEWTPSDFRSNGCIHCINNGGYHGPLPLTTEEYETHIVMEHRPGTPAYPGPADIEKYGLKVPDGNGNGNREASRKSKVAEMADANESGNGAMFEG